VTPEFHRAAQEELAAAVKIGDMRAAGLGLELLRETQRVVAHRRQRPRYRAKRK